MVSAINSALSGLNAATQRLNVSAQNIANLNTPSYQQQQLVQSSQADGGVISRVAPVNQSSQQVSTPSDAAANAYGTSTSDPAQQLVQANIASYDAQGNLSVLKVEKNLFQSVLNIVS